MYWKWFLTIIIRAVQFSCSVVSNSLRPHEPQHARPPCPSPTPRVYKNSCPLSWWCHPTISSSVIPFSSCPQSFPASGSFQMSQLFTSGGQRIGVSASTSVLQMNTQDWSPFGWTGWIFLLSKDSKESSLTPKFKTINSLSEKCKSKPQWGTITHQSGWLLSNSLQAKNAGEGVEKREPSYSVGGNAN